MTGSSVRKPRFMGKSPSKSAYRICHDCGGPGARCITAFGWSHWYCLPESEQKKRRREARERNKRKS